MKWLRERASEVCCINAVKCAAVLWEEQSDGRIASFLCKRFNVNWGKNPWHRHIRGCHGITSDPGRPHKSASGSVRSAADSHCNTQNKCKWCPVVFKGCSWCQISLDTNYLLPGKPTEKKKWRIKKRKSRKRKQKKKKKKGNLHLTGQHGENGGEGVEFQSVDDVAGVEKLETHEAEADHQQQDVEHLGHHGQPQHAYRHQQTAQSDRPRIDASRTSEATRAQNAGEKLCLPFVPTSAIHSSAVQ